jgi:hypothetical protein
MVLSVPTVEEKLLQERINSLVLNKKKAGYIYTINMKHEGTREKKWMNLLWYCALPAVTLYHISAGAV